MYKYFFVFNQFYPFSGLFSIAKYQINSNLDFNEQGRWETGEINFNKNVEFDKNLRKC